MPPPVGYPTRWGEFSSVVLYGGLAFPRFDGIKMTTLVGTQLGGGIGMPSFYRKVCISTL